MKRGTLHPMFRELFPLAVAAVSRQRTRVGIGPDRGEDVRDFDVVCSIVRAEAEKGVDWTRGDMQTLPPEPELTLDQEVEMPTPEDQKGFEIKPEDDATVELPAITKEQLEERRRGTEAAVAAAREEYEAEAPKVTVGQPTVKQGPLEQLLAAREAEASAQMEKAAADAQRLRESLERQQRLARVTSILSGALANPNHHVHNMDQARQIDWALKMERTLILRATRPIPEADLAFKTRAEENAAKQPKSSEPFGRGGA